jgi:uncharacterized protein YkwD
MKFRAGAAEAVPLHPRRLETFVVRTAVAFRLLVALALGFVGTAAAAGKDRPPRPETPAAVALPTYDAPAKHGPAVVPARPSSPPLRVVQPPSARASVLRPVARHPAAPQPRSATVRHASTPRQVAAPTARPAVKPAPKAKPKPPPSPPSPKSGGSNSGYESRILVLVNAQRISHGLAALAMSSCADSYAETWSAHLAAIGALVHSSMGTLLAGCHARFVGENIGYGPVSADAMMAMWMASPSHRANILNPRFTTIGIGAAQTSSGVWYAVQDFVEL